MNAGLPMMLTYLKCITETLDIINGYSITKLLHTEWGKKNPAA